MILGHKKPRPDRADIGTAHERAKLLATVSLFADVKDHPVALDKLAEALVERVYKTDSDIICEGDPGSEMFVLIQGHASVFKSTTEGEPYKVTVIDGSHHPFFGEGALLDADARTATIRADSECHCLVLERKAFEKFSTEHPDWALPILRKITQAVMARLRKSNGDLMLIYNALVAEIRGS